MKADTRRKVDRLFIAIGRLEAKASNLAYASAHDPKDATALRQVQLDLQTTWQKMLENGLVTP